MLATLIYDHRDRTGVIEVRVTHNRKTFYISTGIKVAKRNFVGGTIVNQGDAPELNARLNIIYARVNRALNQCLRDGIEPDAASVRRMALAMNNQEEVSETELADFVEEQAEMLNVSQGTRSRYGVLARNLRTYGMMRSMEDVTVENLCKWDAWLHTQTRRQSDAARKAGKQPRPITDAAVYNYHKCLKAVLNRAVLFGRLAANPYEKLRGKIKRGDKQGVEFLTVEEMRALEGIHPMEGSEMAVARDLFVFQMHTGLSYADLMAFDFSEYQQIGGRYVHIGHRVKTGQQYIVQLDDECMAILEKYGRQLPKIENSNYNRCLKALGMAAGIDKPMHSHLARHSFATYMTAKGAKLENVAKMLGHSSVVMTQRYAKVLPESVFADFQKIEDLSGEKTKKKK